MGGLEPLIKLLAADQPPPLQAGSAYVLGTAVSNNEKLAGALIKEHPKVLQQLLKVGLMLAGHTLGVCHLIKGCVTWPSVAVLTEDVCCGTIRALPAEGVVWA